MSAVKTTSAHVRLPGNLGYLARLGADIEKRWAATSYKPARFAAIASQCLRHYAFHERFDEDEVIAWVNRARSLPPQLDLAATFGQPPLTLWNNTRLVVDLYFWVNTETSIHDHSFVGAFMNLRGDSLHCVYDFNVTQALAPAFLLGDL